MHKYLRRRRIFAIAVLLLAALSTPHYAAAEDNIDATSSLEAIAPASDSEISKSEERFSVHGQTTYVWQYKPAFSAAYSGAKSLLPTTEHGYS
ncbi:hypothetical protein [Cupriavidus sp. TMH.W2]|uniref:hypothetical protein n=1 Tax=Cupriavidus sp. TMH.W2 TaxID=3434465 RepID=UPI003D781B08